MSRKKLKALIAALTVLLLAACANAKETADVGGNAGYDESAADLMAGTLEYLLKEEEAASGEDKEVFPVKEEGEAGQPGEEAALVGVTIYYGNAASDKLSFEEAFVDALTPENLIKELAGHNIVYLDTKVKSFSEEEKDGKKLIYLDLDKTFCEYLKTMSKESEKVILASVTATFLEAYEAEGIVITVEGERLETNYGVYEEPFSYSHEYIDKPDKD